jgi:predicted transcriptional regulator
MDSRRGRTSGSLEAEVIACLAAADGPMTASEVRAELGGQLAYTTVTTTLTRLYAKRALSREPRGRAFAYELVGDLSGSRASVTAHQMHRLLDGGTDRASVLSRFVERLDTESEQLLRQLLSDDYPNTC